MNNYQIITDSGCDLKPDLLEKWDVRKVNLTFCFDSDSVSMTDEDISSKEFYDRMRSGESAKTSAVNADAFLHTFESILQDGKDILYLGFSSALSTTFNSACIAAGELNEKYPDRKIVTIDTRAASAGHGLLVYLAVEKKKAGASLEENAAYIEETLPRTCIWFTVDDLEYLKRGGRVSPAVAFVGGLLGIKPILKINDEGELIKVGTARGKKKSLEALADRFTELADDLTTPIFISHADSEEDVRTFANIIKQRHNVDLTLVTEIGAVIGSHTGPGTLALFFLGKHR